MRENSKPKLRSHTAQIYQDSLYVYGGDNENYYAGPEEDLWCFDISIISSYQLIINIHP